jgi:hypothetical protein
LTGVDQAIRMHFIRLDSLKMRGDVLMTLITFDEEYRRVVEKKGGRLGDDLSNSFLSGISKDAQLIYKAAAHVDGTDNLANGICRIIISFLPKHEVYYGHMLLNEEVDALREQELRDQELREQDFREEEDREQYYEFIAQVNAEGGWIE